MGINKCGLRILKIASLQTERTAYGQRQHLAKRAILKVSQQACRHDRFRPRDAVQSHHDTRRPSTVKTMTACRQRGSSNKCRTAASVGTLSGVRHTGVAQCRAITGRHIEPIMLVSLKASQPFGRRRRTVRRQQPPSGRCDRISVDISGQPPIGSAQTDNQRTRRAVTASATPSASLVRPACHTITHAA